MWQQVYDPFGNPVLSTVAAAIPVATLLVLIATGALKTHLAALTAFLVAVIIVIFFFTMPAGLAIRASILGAVIGFFPIGWIVLNVIFMYRLTVATGAFATLQQAIGGVTADRRLQLLLIAFCFGAFFEGASGFGTPVAVTAAILIGLGFSPLAASGLSLIANTAPVAYGALGTPILGLASVTGLDPYLLGAMLLPRPCLSPEPRGRSPHESRFGGRSCRGSSYAPSCWSGARAGSKRTRTRSSL
jgi:lactate permease